MGMSFDVVIVADVFVDNCFVIEVSVDEDC